MTPGQQRAKDRLDKIMGREKWHQSSGGWISGAIYGANDGLASVFGIVAGVSGATAGSSFVLTAGAAGAIASSLSMATGAFLAERSESEVAAANLERERAEIEQHPEEEKEELSLYYQLKGIDEATADAMAEQLARNPDAMLKALAVEEFGITGDGESNAVQAAVAAGISTGLGAMIPVIPFIFTTGTTAIVISAAVSLIAHFLVGAAKSLVTLRTWWAAGLEMTLAGVIVGGATYLVGLGATHLATATRRSVARAAPRAARPWLRAHADGRPVRAHSSPPHRPPKNHSMACALLRRRLAFAPPSALPPAPRSRSHPAPRRAPARSAPPSGRGAARAVAT